MCGNSCGSFNILAIIAIPLGWLMWLCDLVLPIYALALLLFTILTRLLLFPLSIKQHKSMAKMGALRPKMEQLQKMYANNKEKLQAEQMKLYEEAKYNPLSGCLPTILQMVFLFGLINVIYNPLQHIMQMPQATIDGLKDRAVSVSQILGEADTERTRIETYDMYVITYISKAEKAVADGRMSSNPFEEYDENVTEKSMERIEKFDMNLFGYFLGDTIEVPWPTTTKVAVLDENGEAMKDADGKAVTQEIKKGWTWNWMLLLPLISGITSFLTSIITQKLNPASAEAQQGGGMKMMLYLMPLFSVWIGFSVPSGVVLYWIYSNIAMIGQNVIQYKIWDPKKLADDFAAELEEKEKSRKRKPTVIKVETKNDQGETVVEEKTLTQREADRLRLAEARRRDAEKYGEEYVDVTDDDLK